MRQLKELVLYTRVFYRFAGWRVPMLVLLSFVSGLLDVVGIVALLPLLQQLIFDSSLSQQRNGRRRRHVRTRRLICPP